MKKDSFKQTKRKLSVAWERVQATESTVDFLKFQKLTGVVASDFQNYFINEITHAPVLYDLYNFQGVTYTTDPDLAVPVELYTPNEDSTAFTFNLPIYGYQVLQGVDPAISTGASPWQFVLSVALIKSKTYYLHLSARDLPKLKIVSYFSTEANVRLPSFQFLVDPIDEIYTEYSSFYRWVKLETGFLLEFYAFYPYFADLNLQLNTKVYFMNKGIVNEIQSNKA